jgi:nucleoside-diphosphate-sugar epimerase
MGPVLVTGAAGHLGANLVRAVLADGDQVRVLLRPGGMSAGVEALDVERRFADLRDEAAVRKAVSGCERVYHCGAKISIGRGGEREIFDTNVLGTRNVLTAARDESVERVVVTGSLGAVGDRPDGVADEAVPFDPFSPHTAYEWTKLVVAQEVFRAAAQGMNVVLATSCAIVGPHDYLPSRMGRLLIDFARGRLPAYIAGGFEFVAAGDIAAGHLLAMKHGRAGHNYVFGSGYRSMDQLMALFAELTGRGSPRRLPAGLVAGAARVLGPIAARVAPGREQLITTTSVRLLTSQRRADCAKARDELGYRAGSVDQAIRDAHAHFVERGVLAAAASTAGR